MKADIFETDISKATVITLYLLPSLNVKLRPTILNLKPGTRVVSHAFTMDDWSPDQVDSSEGRTAYMWIVPAKVAGTWRIETAGGKAQALEATLTQQYQNVSGSVKTGAKQGQVSNGKLRGRPLPSPLPTTPMRSGTSPARSTAIASKGPSRAAKAAIRKSSRHESAMPSDERGGRRMRLPRQSLSTLKVEMQHGSGALT